MTEHTHKQFDTEMEAIRSGVLTIYHLQAGQYVEAAASQGGEAQGESAAPAPLWPDMTMRVTFGSPGGA